MFMDILNIPTKKNLLMARQRLALARKGYDLLDKKRQILIRELAIAQGPANQILEELRDTLHAAHAALSYAQTEMGLARVEKISQDMPRDATVVIAYRSIMGVELPLVSNGIMAENSTAKSMRNGLDGADFELFCYTHPVSYDLCETTVSFDTAVFLWNKARELIVTWAAAENTLQRLNNHIKITQKRANALGNITIPMYEARIKYIQERLEERERDELARLKLVKNKSPSPHHSR